MGQHIHEHHHLVGRIAWLRAAVLGANDGIVSTASLIVGVAASQATPHTIFVAGVAGLVSGALSMAAGEYVSVKSQADLEAADIEKERIELERSPEMELEELAGIYRTRGLDPELAHTVAEQLTKKDALKAHLRDELGITDVTRARPLQAAIASALLFATGAFLPLLVSILSPQAYVIPFIYISCLFFLGLLGAVAAFMGGASIWRGILRIAFWGTLAMGVTTGIGHLIGAT